MYFKKALMNTQSTPVLIADIGGTNARLSIVLIEKNTSELKTIEIDKTTYTTFEHANLKSILSNYISKFKNTPHFPKFAVLGIPGALINNKVIVSNALPDLNNTTGAEMAREIGIEHVIYLNDFNVNGYSIQSKILEENVDYIQLNPGVTPEPNTTKAMVGAGTGLGMGYLTKTSLMKYYSVHSSEGGCQDFAPTTELQEKYKNYLAATLKVKCPSVEMACCGSSISIMFWFFEKEMKVQGNKEIIKEMDAAKGCQTKLTKLNEKIIEKGINNTCPLCKKVVDFFIEVYGSICGNLAITLLPFGGIYLLGGVSAALSEYMKKTDIFLKNFVDKAGLNSMLEKIPIYVIINKNLGVGGAAVFAKKVIEEGNIEQIS